MHAYDERPGIKVLAAAVETVIDRITGHLYRDIDALPRRVCLGVVRAGRCIEMDRCRPFPEASRPALRRAPGWRADQPQLTNPCGALLLRAHP